MTAVFTAPPQFTVLAGRQEVGRTDPMLLTEKTDGPRRPQLTNDLRSPQRGAPARSA